MLRRWLSRASATFATASTFAFVSALGALAKPGQSVDGQMGLQTPVTAVARDINSFHDFVNIIIIAIAIFVLLLMIYVLFRFNEKSNPVPTKTTHNSLLEVAWTVIPIAILVVIAVPSFKLLNLQYSYPKADLTIKAIGHQWYWEHEYPDYDGFTVESYMLDDEGIKERVAELKAKGVNDPATLKTMVPRNLAVDYEVVVPVNKNVHVLVSAPADGVIHNWTIPSFGSKTDAVPGRVTTTWFNAEQEGVYFGQCSELCGKDHAFMPIAVRVVDQATFDKWIEAMKADDEDAAKALLESAALRQVGIRSVADAGTSTPSKIEKN
ncbi:MAG: cytochrome c oxidase subunit II [Hyphomicrobiaceae bacterium]